ncbi:MAG: class I SAM-dependent methyltransferase [Oscillospiraceae bacterium]|nr:class I SAM-dependent methyltransferase [Oscillospiraceae bacterium]
MADYYDTYRPSYPDDIIEAIIQKTKLSAGSKLLEIGSGSGKATEQFTGNGFEILCIEPGVDLVKKGIEKFKDKNIEFTVSRFEDFCAPSGYFDTIFSAQAFHWVPQPAGYEKCAQILKKDGFLALFWNIEISYDTDFDKKFMTILNKYCGFVSTMQEADYQKRPETIIAGIAGSDLFKEPEMIQSHWDKQYTADEYYGYLLTGNVFVQNPDEEKQACCEEIKQLASDYNGIFKRHYICELYLTQKK